MRKRNGVSCNRCSYYCNCEIVNSTIRIITNDWISCTSIFSARWEQSVISDGCFISRESWKRTRGKTRFADTCHEHRWSSPSLTSHFQPISRISSTFRVVLVIARFHTPSGLIGTDVLRRRQNKTKIRTIVFDREAYCAVARIISSCIHSNVKDNHPVHVHEWELFFCISDILLSRYCETLVVSPVRNFEKQTL